MRYHQVTDGEWVKPRMRKYYMKCCGCGLVHKLDFKVVKSGRGLAVKFKAKRLKRPNKNE